MVVVDLAAAVAAALVTQVLTLMMVNVKAVEAVELVF
jgi:hypothetical protein